VPNVQWPGQPTSLDSDLLQPTGDLLRGLALLENNPDPGTQEAQTAASTSAFGATPYSMQVITAGSLALSKTAMRIITGLGGFAAVGATVSSFFQNLDPAPQVALLGGAAIVLAASAISIAIVVRADVSARGSAQAAEYQARGLVASNFLQTTAKPTAFAAPDTTALWVQPRGQTEYFQVSHFTPDKTGNQLEAVLRDGKGTRVALQDIADSRIG
jgi:hypothetical protein